MCFIATIVKIKEDESSIYPIAKLLAEEQQSNDDGTGHYCFNRAGGHSHAQEMTESIESMAKNVKDFDVSCYHFRNATEGVVDESNVHFWKRSNWLFCHNGMINKFGVGDKSDSLSFFEKLVELGHLTDDSIDWKAIKDFTNTTNFSGRFILIHAITHKMYFFGNYDGYLINRSYLVLTSTTSTFKNAINVLGMEFGIESDLEVLEGGIDGIVSFDGQFEQLDIEFKVYTSQWTGKPVNFEEANYKDYTNQNAVTEDSEANLENAEYAREFRKITEKREAEEQKLLEGGYNIDVDAKLEELDNKYYQDIYLLDEMYINATNKEQLQENRLMEMGY